MDDYEPRIHRLKASCCEAEVVNFDLPWRAPIRLVSTALTCGWRLSGSGDWFCNAHKKGNV